MQTTNQKVTHQVLKLPDNRIVTVPIKTTSLTPLHNNKTILKPVDTKGVVANHNTVFTTSVQGNRLSLVPQNLANQSPQLVSIITLFFVNALHTFVCGVDRLHYLHMHIIE